VSAQFADHVLADSPADLPVEHDEPGVDRLGDALPGCFDHRADIAQKAIRGGRGKRRPLLAPLLLHLITPLSICWISPNTVIKLAFSPKLFVRPSDLPPTSPTAAVRAREKRGQHISPTHRRKYLA
jgi:hypothetical protein